MASGICNFWNLEFWGGDLSWDQKNWLGLQTKKILIFSRHENPMSAKKTPGFIGSKKTSYEEEGKKRQVCFNILAMTDG